MYAVRGGVPRGNPMAYFPIHYLADMYKPLREIKVVVSL